jgi:hypothetical protein
VVLFFFYSVINYLRNLCRKKTDLEFHLGIALAKVNNFEETDAKYKGVLGVGNDPQHVDGWIEDIWECFDKDGNGSICRDEIKKFIDQTFEAANYSVAYSPLDFSKLFADLDLSEDGLISKAEMRNFLFKLDRRANELD